VHGNADAKENAPASRQGGKRLMLDAEPDFLGARRLVDTGQAPFWMLV
jgi:hypothetical protein